MKENKKALAGVNILSFAQILQGAAAVQYLADLGADVIKVERPEKGEYARSWSGLDLYINGESLFYLCLNRNQKGVTVNIKKEKGKEIIYKLIKNTDVLVENFRPGVMERLRLSYKELSKINPRLIYASASGWGSDGPYRDKPGQDLLAQSLGGLASVTGKRDDFPTPVGASVGDQHSASLLALGILAALFYRERAGKGQKIEVSLLQSVMDLQAEALAYYLNGGGVKSITRSQSGISMPYMEAPYGIYKTRDGYLAISLIPLEKLAELLEIEKLNDYFGKDILDKKDEIKKIIQERIKDRTTNDWIDILEKENLWCAPVKNYEQLVNDPQVKYNQSIKEIKSDHIGKIKVIGCPIRLTETPAGIYSAPPMLGEHNKKVLNSLGYCDGEIEILKRERVI